MVMNLCMWIRSWNGEIPMPAIIYHPFKGCKYTHFGKAKYNYLWTGKQLFSLIIPVYIILFIGKN